MNVLDLFSGIGGFSLGLERAGFTTVAFCEIDPYCQAVLRKHWPDVPIYGDIRTLTAAQLMADAESFGHSGGQENGRKRPTNKQDWGGLGSTTSGFGIDVICGGFPCQDISTAGKGAGLGGERSGLWSEYARIIGEVRPRYVIVENVAALLGRGIERVLGDLAALGFDAEWHCIPASAVGAPHRRDRVWIVAYADRPRLEGWLRAELSKCAGECAAGTGSSQWDEQRWFAQSGMGRVAHGTANRVDRLRALGNAVVPQIPEIIGRAILNGTRAAGPPGELRSRL